MKIYELIIAGAGPAGITAAVYAARKQIDFTVITKGIGGQAALSGEVGNYTGYQFISGPELALKFEEHMKSFAISLNMPETVLAIEAQGKLLKVTTDKAQYQAKSIIAATGKRSRQLNVPGEKEYKNKGISYCATCDAPLFKNKKVAVIGGGNSALDAVLQLMNIASQVYVINQTEKVKADAVMLKKIQEASKVEIWNKALVRRIYGDTFVKGIEVDRGNQIYQLDVEGVFIEIGLIPNSEYAGILRQNELGEIIVDCHNRTSVEGIFAAGDVTNVPEKQIIIACGEGAKASLSAFKCLSGLAL